MFGFLSLVAQLTLATVYTNVSKKTPYSWLARWLEEVVDKKLKVVIRPVGVVQYWRQPSGGLKIG